MLLRYFYSEMLSHASYLLGCPQAGDAEGLPIEGAGRE
jgi:hypothetical protein